MSSPFSAPDSGPWLIRTDFTDDRTWQHVGAASAVDPDAPEPTAAADVFRLVDDPGFEGLTPAGLLAAEPYPHDTFLLVDDLAITHPEHPVLAVDVYEEPGRSFRLVPAEVFGFVVNRSIANLDFSDYADAVGPDGIFRGFYDHSGTPAGDDGSFTLEVPARFGHEWEPTEETPERPRPYPTDADLSPMTASALAALDRWMTYAPEEREEAAVQTFRLGVFLRGFEPAGAAHVFALAVAAGEPEPAAAAAFQLADIRAATDPAGVLTAYEVATTPWLAVTDDATAALCGWLRSADREATAAGLRTALDSGEPPGLLAAMTTLGERLVHADKEAAGVLYQLMIDTRSLEAAPAGAVNLANLLRDTDPAAAGVAYRQAIGSGHPEHAPWAAFHHGEMLSHTDPAAARELYQVAIDHRHPDASPAAAVLMATSLTKAGDVAGARRCLQMAVDSGNRQFAPGAARRLKLLPPTED